MVVDKWDYILATVLILSVVFTLGATRIQTNIVRGRMPLDFFTELEPDPTATWENLPTSRAWMYGVFVAIQNAVTATYIGVFLMVIHKLVYKAGWFRKGG